MPKNYSPTLNHYSGHGSFRFWCQKVLPLVYDDSLSYYELLNKVVHYLNNVIGDINGLFYLMNEIIENANADNLLIYDLGVKKIFAQSGRNYFFPQNNKYSSVLSIFNLPAGYENIQGCCYNPDTERLIVAFRNNDATMAILVEMSLDLKTMYNASEPLPIGHANSLTYNTKTRTILCACGNTGTNANKIVEINAETYSLITAYSVMNGVTPWAISYDELNDVIYYSNYDTLVIADNAMHTIYSVEIERFTNSTTPLTAQGGFSLDGNFYIIYSNYKLTYFCYYDLTTGKIKKSYSINNSFAGEEAEDATTVNGNVYVISGQTTVNGYLLNSSDNVIGDDASSLYHSGAIIPNNTDLNTVTNTGNYTVSSTANANTMQNRPNISASGFSLHVVPLGFRHLMQIYVPNNDDKIMAVRKSSGDATGEWNKWHNVQSTKAKGDSVSMNGFGAAGLLTGGSKQVIFPIPSSDYFDDSFTENYSITGGISIRQNGSYLIGTGSTGQSLTDSSVVSSRTLVNKNGELFLTVNFVNAFSGATNNDVVYIQFFNLTITSNN